MATDATSARKIGVFNYECAEGHHSCSNEFGLEWCPWPTRGPLSTCGAELKDLCWVYDFEYSIAIAERDAALAELARLRETVAVSGMDYDTWAAWRDEELGKRDAELARLRHADTILRKMMAHREIGVSERGGLRFFQYRFPNLLDAGELEYLRALGAAAVGVLSEGDE